MLGSVLFIIFIKDLPESIKNESKLYADDCKLIGATRNEMGTQEIQSDINRLQETVRKLKMSFNYGKCSVRS